MNVYEWTNESELQRLVHQTNNFLCLCTVQAETALELGDELAARRALQMILDRARALAREVEGFEERVLRAHPSMSQESPDGSASE